MQLIDGLTLWESVLEIYDVSVEDYKEYICKAYNNLGVDETRLKLRPPARPAAPVSFIVSKVDNRTY